MLARTGKAAVIQPTGTGKSFVAFKLMEDRPRDRFCWVSPSEYIWRTQLENLQKAVGAEEWGKGVNALLTDHPGADLLGLTATPIRYLDQQRDMADELFDGCIAHQMTLGEAIVQDILPAPKYVMALYAFQQELSRYVRRARRVGGAAGQKAERIIDQLRRRLEEADGVDVIFQKHMQDKHGKYILFCADREHMRTIRRRLPQWLSRVDTKPHIYEVYAESGEAAKAFDDFKRDQSKHIKVLLCIDQQAVLYKQEHGNLDVPVAYEAEGIRLRRWLNHQRELYQKGKLTAEREEKLNALGMVWQLEDGWQSNFKAAQRFYQENGHLNIPMTVITEQGTWLGKWIYLQRKAREQGRLSQEKIHALESIGMEW